MDHTAEYDAAWRELLNAMVDKLKADGMLTDPRVEHAMRTVPRHEFLLEEGDAEYAYTGDLIRTLAGADGGTLSTASQVTIVALMLRVLNLRPGENVLEVGLGTGYKRWPARSPRWDRSRHRDRQRTLVGPASGAEPGEAGCGERHLDRGRRLAGTRSQRAIRRADCDGQPARHLATLDGSATRGGKDRRPDVDLHDRPAWRTVRAIRRAPCG